MAEKVCPAFLHLNSVVVVQVMMSMCGWGGGKQKAEQASLMKKALHRPRFATLMSRQVEKTRNHRISIWFYCQGEQRTFITGLISLNMMNL